MAEQELSVRFRVLAFAGVLGIFAIIFLYLKEMQWLNNTIGEWYLMAGSAIAGLSAAGYFLYRKWDRFSPWEAHLPELVTIVVLSALVSPLLGGWLNRGLCGSEFQSFEFLSETPYAASSYGFLRADKLKLTGYILEVREKGQVRRFKYRKQAYFPLTQPGEPILLPMKKGLFGCRVLALE